MVQLKKHKGLLHVVNVTCVVAPVEMVYKSCVFKCPLDHFSTQASLRTSSGIASILSNLALAGESHHLLPCTV